jgi:uncharacterized protein
MIIDFHTHIFPPFIQKDRASYLSDPLFGLLYSSEKAKLAAADDLLANMEKEGIDFSLALNIGWASGEMCRKTNDYIIETVARNAKRIAGFGTVALNNVKEAIKEVERCAAGGLKGIGEMRLARDLFSPGDPRLDEFVRSLISYRMPLLLHCSEPVGHQYPGKGDTTPDLILRLIERFPGLSLICAHWGGGLPFYALMPEVKQALANVKFDTAASPFLYSPQIYRQAIDVVGAGAVIFGTDYPLIGQARSLREVKDLNLPMEIAEQILVRNARDLLGIKV